MISILIVLYDKEIAESETIKSLIKYSSKDIEITIFNNGPNLLSDTSTTLTNMRNRFNNVKVIECVCNKPLSILYNDFYHPIIHQRGSSYLMMTQL